MKKRLYSLFLLSWVATTVSAQDAVMLLKVPGITGQYDNPILGDDLVELSSISFVENNTVNIGSISGGGGAGKATAPLITLKLRIDSSFPQLAAKITSNQLVPEVMLEIHKPYDSQYFIQEKISLGLVRFKSWEATHISEGDVAAGNVKLILAIGCMKREYKRINNAGTAVINGGETIWSYLRNKSEYHTTL